MNQLTVFNKALANLGLRQLTGDNEDSSAADACNANIQGDIESVLHRHPWNCAVHRATLAPLPAIADVDDDAAAFQLPEDCLRVLRTDSKLSDGFWWKVEGTTLVTNADAVTISYVRRRTVDQLSPLCAEAVALKLAATIAMILTSSRERATDMERKYEMAVSNAQFADALEGQGDRLMPGYLTTAHET